jgi:hypothetical protein
MKKDAVQLLHSANSRLDYDNKLDILGSLLQ